MKTSFKQNAVLQAINYLLTKKNRRTLVSDNIHDADNNILYVVENNLTRKKLNSYLRTTNGYRDVFFLDVLEVPDDVFEMERYLEEKIV